MGHALRPAAGHGPPLVAAGRGVDAALGHGLCREELRQLLLLLADRADHRRLHPLPWAKPVPLRVHGRTCREEACAEVLAAYCCAEAPRSHS